MPRGSIKKLRLKCWKILDKKSGFLEQKMFSRSKKRVEEMKRMINKELKREHIIKKC